MDVINRYLFPAILKIKRSPTLSTDGKTLRNSVKLWKLVLSTILYHLASGALLSGCFSQNCINALREMMCTKALYLNLRYNASPRIYVSIETGLTALSTTHPFRQAQREYKSKACQRSHHSDPLIHLLIYLHQSPGKIHSASHP